MAKKYIALEETSQAILAAAQQISLATQQIFLATPQILTRVTKIDLVTSTVVTGNPFEIGFGDISDLVVTGTWDPAAARVKF